MVPVSREIGTTLIILTLNEVEGSKALFESIPFPSVDEAFVVDGGSTDGTVEFFQGQGIPVYIQDRPGRGEAFRSAAARAHGSRWVFFSPDGNEDPADIPRLLALLEKGYDMAIASRFLPGARNEEDDLRFPWRAWANRSFTRLANAIWNRGPYISDTINGYRAVTREAFERLNPDAPGFVIEYQMSIRAMKLGMSVAEIPTLEGHRIGGESKASSLPTGFIFLKVLLREMALGRGFARAPGEKP